MHRRINITLPEDTVTIMDRVARRGNRSRFIDAAVRHYMGVRSRAQLKKRLKEGALARARRDLRLAQEWFLSDEEAWPSVHR